MRKCTWKRKKYINMYKFFLCQMFTLNKLCRSSDTLKIKKTGKNFGK